MKRVFIVHGWNGRPDKGWLNWLNLELTNRGFKVFADKMPNPEFPKIEPWVNHLKILVSKTDKDTYFVGHSVGCQTIIRFIETLSEKSEIGGAVFVGGWLKLKEPKTKDEKNVSEPWLNTPINFNKVRRILNKSLLLLSDDDPFVPQENTVLFRDKLGSKVIKGHGKGHYIEREIKEIPLLLNNILELLK